MSRSASPLALAACAVLLAAAPAAAKQKEANSVNQEPDVQDVAMTPLTDLNLAKADIPDLLVRAHADPYADEGLKTCKDIEAAISDLDAVLGPDADVTEDDRDRISWGRVATSAVGSFIPFRSILRELTGAADHRRDFQAAIVSGAVRRGFLKGLGQQKKCAYPARPAFARVKVTDAPQPTTRDKLPEGRVTFVSEEVVQQVAGEQPRRN